MKLNLLHAGTLCYDCCVDTIVLGLSRKAGWPKSEKGNFWYLQPVISYVELYVEPVTYVWNSYLPIRGI